ncbi:hypothetical protein GE09DRAFT_948112 [Coniochaeta sp. 2T2.1]|nr:hypothetical protein GE09DRAFT_948112 [Coniochaeta sp. 2T2.1]
MSNGAARRDNASFPRKDSGDARVLNNNGKTEGRSANGRHWRTSRPLLTELTTSIGSRTGFRTDTSISNSTASMGRELKRWNAPPESKNDDKNMGLEGSGGAAWDQFQVNERLFGLKTDYDENIYTTAIDKSHPNFPQRMAMAEKFAREISSSSPTTAHQAEERVMDYAGGADDTNEEDNGVRRGDFPPLESRENKYTPPARRAPTGHATVKGAPFDPAIISSQLKAPAPKQATTKSEENKLPSASAKPSTTLTPEVKVSEAKPSARPESKANDTALPTAKPEQDNKGTTTIPLQPSATTSRTISPQTSQGNNTPVAPINTVEKDVYASFKSFASRERTIHEKARNTKARQDKEVKLHELKKFGADFKLSTPVPKDLISIIAKDPEKQKAIQEKALRDAQEVAKAAKVKAEQEASAAAAKQKQPSVSKEVPQTKVPTEPTTSTAATPAPAVDNRGASRPTAPQHSSSPSAVPGRNPSGRQSYGPQTNYQQGYRNNRQNAQYGGQQPTQTGHLAQRIREKQMHQPQHPHMNPNMPMVPTGPANFDTTYGPRRLSGLPPSHLQQAKLNPNSHEFRPNAFAPAFNPAGPSQASSPRSAINVLDPHLMARTPPARGQLIRRKTKAVDVAKCNILLYLKTVKPGPNAIPNYDENLGLRPSFQTPVTWRQFFEIPDVVKPEDNMTYKEYFARQPSSTATPAPPVAQHVPAGMPHQHQLPLHLQGPPHMGPRQSPHMASMQMHNGQHGPMPPVPYNNHPDDHRMVHSNSQQSFASPRMASQMPMAYPPNMNSPAPMPYTQPMVQPYPNNGGAPPMNPNYRSFSHNPQYGMHQQHGMGPQLMFQPQYMPQNGMGPAAQQVPMYNGAQGQFMPPGPIPPPSVAGSNGFPSPGRPAAPMMAHQGSHQGQPMVYGVSPAMQYQQPYPAHQPPNKYQGQRP